MSGKAINRREFLGSAAGAAAVLALGGTSAGLLRPRGYNLVRAALSTRPRGSDLDAIKHVVFLMHENRSFDHYFGILAGVNGFATSSPAFAQNWPGGDDSTLLPYHLDVTSGIAECTYDLNHSWQAEHSSWNGGAMDSFVSTHTMAPELNGYGGEGSLGTLTMGYYDSNDIPFYYALAENFTICDSYFCSVLGPTHPNRLMQMTGTIDPAGVAGGPVVVTNSSNEPFTGSCTWTTMPEILSAAGVSWKVYNPYGPSYQPYSQANGTGDGVSMALCKNPLFYMEQFQTYSTDPSSLWQLAFGNCGIPIPDTKTVYDGSTGSLLSPGGGPNNLAHDVETGTLPAVSWIIPPLGYDEHPPAPAALGEWYTAQVLKTLMSNKEVWESTVLFIMYDENDGWFDHVAPPTAPADTSGEYITASNAPSYTVGQPIGLGVRVPMLVVSPFSAGGWVCSDVFDHTSQLQFLGAVFGVDATVDGNVSAWRQSTVGDLTTALPNLPLPTTSKGKPIYPKNPTLPKTSDKMTAAPISVPTQCNTNNDLSEVNGDFGDYDAIPNCNTTSGSNVVTNSGVGFVWTSSGVYVGQGVSGPGIPANTTVTSVKGTKVTLSAAATATGSAVTLEFLQPYTPYPIPNPQSQPMPVGTPLKPTPN